MNVGNKETMNTCKLKYNIEFVETLEESPEDWGDDENKTKKVLMLLKEEVEKALVMKGFIPENLSVEFELLEERS